MYAQCCIYGAYALLLADVLHGYVSLVIIMNWLVHMGSDNLKI